MSERTVKTHVLANTDLSSILEPDEFTSRPAECKGELRHALSASGRSQITKEELPACGTMLEVNGTDCLLGIEKDSIAAIEEMTVCLRSQSASRLAFEYAPRHASTSLVKQSVRTEEGR